MSRHHRATLSAWQKQLVDELKALTRGHSGEVRIVQQPQLDPVGDASLRIRLHTADIPRCPGGLTLGDDEEFIVRIHASLFLPPVSKLTTLASSGSRTSSKAAALYLPRSSREWRPSDGMAGLLSRLWQWLTDAAGGVFDASTAMYHAVGGVLHHAVDTPTIVVRESGPTKPRQIAQLIRRSAHRYDLTYSTGGDGLRAPVFTLASDLPFGAASTFALFLTLLDDPYLDRVEGRPPRVSPQSPAL